MEIDTRDVVFHRPTGEYLVVAYCENGKVCCCGWPNSLVNESDCRLHRKATVEQRDDLLADLSKLSDSRGSYARRRLAHDANERARDGLTFEYRELDQK